MKWFSLGCLFVILVCVAIAWQIHSCQKEFAYALRIELDLSSIEFQASNIRESAKTSLLELSESEIQHLVQMSRDLKVNTRKFFPIAEHLGHSHLLRLEHAGRDLSEAAATLRSALEVATVDRGSHSYEEINEAATNIQTAADDIVALRAGHTEEYLAAPNSKEKRGGEGWTVFGWIKEHIVAIATVVGALAAVISAIVALAVYTEKNKDLTNQ